MISASRCVHLAGIGLTSHSDIELAKERTQCSLCEVRGPNLWLCLHRDCFCVACGDGGFDHSLQHYQKMTNHCVHLNLTTMRVWCYQCDTEVFLEPVGSGGEQPQLASACRFRHVETIDNDDSDDSRSTVDDNAKPIGASICPGLTGLQNIGNTCYMNAALQALSNTPPLTQFFLACSVTALNSSEPGKKPPTLSRSYHRLMQELWHRKRPGYVAPTGILYGIRNAHPMFRGYHQHDTQEFLRCFMDQLHEELKVPLVEPPPPHNTRRPLHLRRVSSLEELSEEEAESSGSGRSNAMETEGGGASSQSEGEEYETCDSGVSERSSLSDEGSNGGSRKTRSLSRTPSPTQERLRSKLTSKSHTYCSAHASPTRSHRRKTQKFRSIISDVFDGKLLSSVQCLTCNRISTRVETFQDLSLPIPNRDHLNMLHQGSVNIAKCSELYSTNQSWLSWIWDWVCSWFWGPTVSLHDCLAAFFSADELKGDNMYSCEKCNKLRNGVKYSKLLELPEVLCIHLKRFRHELMFSSKINSYVTFPLDGLDLRPYLHKDCVSQVTTYNLVSVICHHGAAGSGGHYTCYSLNDQCEQWYEFDDQCVTRVSTETVRNCEAYVLFYRKTGSSICKYRQQVGHLLEMTVDDPGPHYILSKQWVNRFNTFAEPGPIDNTDLLCSHGSLLPGREHAVNQLTTTVPAPVWDYLYQKFGGGPVCTVNQLNICETCMQDSYYRPEAELREYAQLGLEYQISGGVNQQMYAVSLSWFSQWDAYVKGQTADPPGPIENSNITFHEFTPTQGKDYIQVTAEQWNMLHRIYGGGPEILISLQQPTSPGSPDRSSTPGNWSNHNGSIPSVHLTSETSNPDSRNQADLTEIQTMDMSMESLNADMKTEPTLSSSVSLSDIRVTPAEPKIENQIITEIC